MNEKIYEIEKVTKAQTEEFKKLTDLKVIALSGRENSGKTSTLNFLITLLKLKYKIIAYAKAGIYTLDIIVIVEVDGKYVGITTRGDFDYMIEEDLCRIYITAQTLGIDILLFVCACHTSGKTLEALRNLTKTGILQIYSKVYYELYDRGVRIKRLDQTVKKREDAVNECQAKCLLNAIETVLGI